jgi:mRNA-degrading endonuclease RelE of RelBE toxin-antitoxin system
MTWRLRIAKPAGKELERSPVKDQGYIKVGLADMQANPFSGDIVRLKNQPATFRRRAGNYRIFFDLDPETGLVDVVAIKRRTSSSDPESNFQSAITA